MRHIIKHSSNGPMIPWPPWPTPKARAAAGASGSRDRQLGQLHRGQLIAEGRHGDATGGAREPRGGAGAERFLGGKSLWDLWEIPGDLMI